MLTILLIKCKSQPHGQPHAGAISLRSVWCCYCAVVLHKPVQRGLQPTREVMRLLCSTVQLVWAHMCSNFLSSETVRQAGITLDHICYIAYPNGTDAGGLGLRCNLNTENCALQFTAIHMQLLSKLIDKPVLLLQGFCQHARKGMLYRHDCPGALITNCYKALARA